MKDSGWQWGGLEIATIAIVGTAGAIGGLWGFSSGLTQDVPVIGRIVLALVQGVGAALLLGLAALLALAIGTAVWGLVSKASRR